MYQLDPLKRHQLATELRAIFPKLYNALFVEKPPAYECRRNFCTFCLRNVYDDNVNEIAKMKNWHCHHCTGYCMCTRCTLQDNATHAKAYLMSLGGNLQVLDKSSSMFDKFIKKAFDEHLELTVGLNQWLYEKYPYYASLINGLPYDTDGDEDDGSSQKEDQNERNSAKPAASVFGFVNEKRSIADAKLSSSQQFARDLETQMESEKVGASLLFKYALINKKMDDVNNVLASSVV